MPSLEFHVSVKRETQLSVKVCEVKKQEMDWREIKKTEKGRDKETNRSGNRERYRITKEIKIDNHDDMLWKTE